NSNDCRFRIEADPELPAILGNPDAIQTVIKNLLSNAVKFSERGSTVTLKAEPLDDQVILSVTDTGEGIKEEIINKIFDRFYRIDNTDRRMVGGAGLGLTLVREIVHRHNGKVWAQSTPGKGSIFYVSLPAASS
ncbi:MAG: ATP-binding protein, partial [Desulfuromonadales bacterium]|nr:ATP-binding protein [Desulfuromonadales bacterium]NIR32999.1 ATP-binding protein [Desulfuromonadales bacterium]NIS40548.1 ATP-binding protein [Desulfuromonadales bacterium]